MCNKSKGKKQQRKRRRGKNQQKIEKVEIDDCLNFIFDIGSHESDLVRNDRENWNWNKGRILSGKTNIEYGDNRKATNRITKPTKSW